MVLLALATLGNMTNTICVEHPKVDRATKTIIKVRGIFFNAKS